MCVVSVVSESLQREKTPEISGDARTPVISRPPHPRAGTLSADSQTERTMDKIPTGTWVVVADGEGARLFTNVGTERSVEGWRRHAASPLDVNRSPLWWGSLRNSDPVAG